MSGAVGQRNIGALRLEKSEIHNKRMMSMLLSLFIRFSHYTVSTVLALIRLCSALVVYITTEYHLITHSHQSMTAPKTFESQYTFLLQVASFPYFTILCYQTQKCIHLVVWPVNYQCYIFLPHLSICSQILQSHQFVLNLFFSS